MDIPENTVLLRNIRNTVDLEKNSGYQGRSKSNLRLLTGTERKVIYKGIKPAGIAVNFFIKGIGFQAQVESFIK